MRNFTSTELANNTGDVLAIAAQEAVGIKRHGKTRFVVLSAEGYERLRRRGETRRAIHLEDMSDSEAEKLTALLEAELNRD